MVGIVELARAGHGKRSVSQTRKTCSALSILGHRSRTWRLPATSDRRPRPQQRRHHGQPYDAIVVGARCAGSPTAMLLARKGYRVLVVDRATFPSDTVSTHIVQPLAAPLWRDGDCSMRSSQRGARRLTRTPSTSVLSRLAGAPGTTDARSRTVRDGPSWTSCSSMPRTKQAPRFARASLSRRLLYG